MLGGFLLPAGSRNTSPCPLPRYALSIAPQKPSVPFMYYFPTWNSPSSHPTCEQEQMPSHLSRPMLQIMPAMPVLFPSLCSLSLAHPLPLSLNLLPFLLFFLFSSFVLTKQISCSLRRSVRFSMLVLNFTVRQLYVCVRLHVLACSIRFHVHVHYQVVISLKAEVFITYPIFCQLNSFWKMFWVNLMRSNIFMHPSSKTGQVKA